MTARTVSKSVEVSGPGLHSGQTVRVRINPDPLGRGIRFVRVDLPNKPTIAAFDIDANCPPFRTGLKNGAAEVHTVEHLFSALAGAGITSCEIEIDGPECPGLDGSALEFLNTIRAAGVTEIETQHVEPLIVRERVVIEDGPASIEALPNSSGLTISYTLHYPGHSLAQGTHTFEFSEHAYLREIAPARTFAIRPEAEKMLALGFGKGANTTNTVIVEGDRAIDTQLRFPNEPVRHKILDLIGDLYVLGRPLRAHLIAKVSGHKANRLLALKLKELYG